MNQIPRLFFLCFYPAIRFYYIVLLLSTIVLSCAFNSAYAQLVYNESFEHVIPGINYKIPLGWSQDRLGGSVDLDNKWYCSNIAVFPTISARTGTDMLGFNAKDVHIGEASFLATKKLDMRNGMPAGGANFNFWFFR